MTSGVPVTLLLGDSETKEFAYATPQADTVVTYDYQGPDHIRFQFGPMRRPINSGCWKILACDGRCGGSFDKYNAGDQNGLIYFMVRSLGAAANVTVKISSSAVTGSGSLNAVSTTSLAQAVGGATRHYTLSGYATGGLTLGQIFISFENANIDNRVTLSRLGNTLARTYAFRSQVIAPCSLEKETGDYYLAIAWQQATTLTLDFIAPPTLVPGQPITRSIDNAQSRFFLPDATITAPSFITLKYPRSERYDFRMNIIDLATLGCPRTYGSVMCSNSFCYMPVFDTAFLNNRWIEVTRELTSDNFWKNFTIGVESFTPKPLATLGAKHSGSLNNGSFTQFSISREVAMAVEIYVEVTARTHIAVYASGKLCYYLDDLYSGYLTITLQRSSCGYSWDWNPNPWTNDVLVVMMTYENPVNYNITLQAEGPATLCQVPTTLLNSSCAAYADSLVPTDLQQDEAVIEATYNLEQFKALYPTLTASTSCLNAIKELSCRAATTRCNSQTGVAHPGLCYEKCTSLLDVCGANADLKQRLCEYREACPVLPPTTVYIPPSEAPISADTPSTAPDGSSVGRAPTSSASTVSFGAATAIIAMIAASLLL